MLKSQYQLFIGLVLRYPALLPSLLVSIPCNKIKQNRVVQTPTTIFPKYTNLTQSVVHPFAGASSEYLLRQSMVPRASAQEELYGFEISTNLRSL